MAPSLVQSKSATAASVTTVTVTLTSSTTAGNCLIVAVVTSASPSNPTVSGITLGGAAGNFAQSATAGNPSVDSESVFIWADPNCAGGQTAVSVTLSAASGSCNVWVMEWSGLVTSTPVDKTAGQAQSAVTSWSSTATATTTQASEVAVGAVGTFNGTGVGTITGPSSPWTNLAQVTSASTHVGLLAGYNILSSTGTVTYSGTFASSSDGATAVATFKAAAAAATDNSPYVIAQNTGFF